MNTVICTSCHGIRAREACDRCGGTGVIYVDTQHTKDGPKGSNHAALETVNSVAAYANELKKSVELFIEQLEAAGLGRRSAHDELSLSDRKALLKYLKKRKKSVQS